MCGLTDSYFVVARPLILTHTIISRSPQHAATHCNTHNATHCNTHNATHCNILQHTATHCNTNSELHYVFALFMHATHCNKQAAANRMGGF